MGLCGFGFGGYKEKIDPKIVLVSLFQGRLFNGGYAIVYKNGKFIKGTLLKNNQLGKF